MDCREAMMKDTAMPTVLPQQSVASTLNDPSQMAVLEAPDPIAYIPLPPVPFDDIYAGIDSCSAGDIPSYSTSGLVDTEVPIQDIYEPYSTFLDDLEFQRLYEWDMMLSLAHLKWHAQYPDYLIQYMVASITTPLKDDPNAEGFHHIIDDVESRLHAGLLLNPREVEIRLIINGKNNARSSEAFEHYKMAVIDSCDRAMEQTDSSWHNQYYAAAIDDVQAESMKHGNHQMLEAQLEGQDTNMPAVFRPYRSEGASPQSVTSAETESMDDISPSSPTTLDLSTSVSSLGTDTSNSYSKSPPTAAAGLPTLPSSQNPATDTFHCHPCNKTFFDRANLRRHQRTSKAHGDGSMYPCLMPGCTKSYTRPDNLRTHARKDHNGVYTHTSAAAGAMN